MQIIKIRIEAQFNIQNSEFHSPKFLETYFMGNQSKLGFGILEINEIVLIPFQIIKQDLAEFSNPKQYKYLQNCFSHNAYKLIEQIICSLHKPINMLVLGNIFITGKDGFSNLKLEKQQSFIDKHFLKLIFEKFNTCDLVVFKDLDQNLAHHKSGLISIPVLPQMNLKIYEAWLTVEDYMDALSSKYRVRIKSAVSKSKTLIKQELTCQEIEKYAEDLHQLYLHVYDKAAYKIMPINSTCLLALKKQFDKNFIVHAWFEDNKLIAFNSLFLMGPNSHATMIGLEYSVNDKYKLYQTLLFDLIGSAIQNKATMLNMGRTAMEIKSTFGAEPIQTYSFAKFRRRANQMLLKKLITNYALPTWIQRKPFKNQVHTEVDQAEHLQAQA